MELIPESVEALSHVSERDGRDLSEEVLQIADRVVEIVPACVGISITVDYGALTFTLASSTQEVEELDRMQPVAGGPCVTAARTGDLQSVDDVLDEDRWQAFAGAAAAAGVRSSLSIPLAVGDETWGSLNLYAADPRAFDGVHDILRDVAGSRSGRLVTNADLGFETRRYARSAPEALRHGAVVNRAVGLLMAEYGTDADDARERLEHVAARSGVDLLDAALSVLGDDHPQH